MLFLLIFLFVLIILFVFGYSWYRLHKEIHVHVSGYIDTPKNSGLIYKDFTTLTKDGLKIKGWYIPVDSPKAFVILLHGRVSRNGGKALMLSHCVYLHRHGYATLLFDMRGVGESEGNMTTLGVEEWMDASSVYSYTKSLPEARGKKIGFLGISMGASVAIVASGKEKIGDFIIASAPFKNLLSLFSMQVKQEKLFPNFLFTWALLLAAFFELSPLYFLYSPIRFIEKIVAPILIISAKNDTMVNPRDPWDLVQKANKPNGFWEVDSTHQTHGELRGEFEEKVLSFLNVYAI